MLRKLQQYRLHISHCNDFLDSFVNMSFVTTHGKLINPELAQQGRYFSTDTRANQLKSLDIPINESSPPYLSDPKYLVNRRGLEEEFGSEHLWQPPQGPGVDSCMSIHFRFMKSFGDEVAI